jgi:hypothetical protein
MFSAGRLFAGTAGGSYTEDEKEDAESLIISTKLETVLIKSEVTRF